MRFTIIIFQMAILLPVISLAQISDHEIVESYRISYHQLNKELSAASTAADLEAILQKIDSLNQMAKENESLFEYAFFPDKPDAQLNGIRIHTQRYFEFYMLAEHSSEKMEALQKQLIQAENEIAVIVRKYSEQRGELDLAMIENKELQRSLDGYRRLVSQRDELVFVLVDSLLLHGQGFLPVHASNTSEVSTGSMPVSSDPLALVSATLDAQIEALSVQADYLSVLDLLRTYSGYQRLHERWLRVRPAFEDISGTRNSIILIDDQLKNLRIRTGSDFWSRVGVQLREQGLKVEILDNSTTFLSWLDGQIKVWEREAGARFNLTDDTEALIAFHTYWQDHFEGSWRTDLVSSDLISEEELIRISRTVDQIVLESRPMPVWILLMGMLCVLTLGVFAIFMYRANSM